MNGTRARIVTPLALLVLTGLVAPLAYAESTRPAKQSQTNASLRRVVVSLADRKLAVIDNGDVVRVFSVSVGAPKSPSPVGTFTIVNRITHPTYYRPGRVIGPGPANPLGTRWLGFDHKGYGIHGTDDPKSIGHARSHGCIRLRNKDVEELFNLLRTGDVVELRVESFAETLGEVRSAVRSAGL